MLAPRFPAVLASGSPRRQELLRQLLAEFEVLVSDVHEHDPESADPWVLAQVLAQEKAAAVAALRPSHIVIGGDTVVALPDIGQAMKRLQREQPMQLLGKPGSPEGARQMLKDLSGRSHLVVTGMALRWPGGAHTFSETSIVTFRPLSEQEIADYVATGESLDKAGAYGAQGEAAKLIQSVEGPLSNVIGLPIGALRSELLRLGLAVPMEPHESQGPGLL
ncbi:MAG: septum formation protein Maf [Armatimonadetes bacterium]|nr:septum formation protein Maf [Armatimonadota bacterium]